ncbi:MAG: hypothetical protein M1339_01710 [Bacteroidetes bacterium]|nr:hypothetical protein [Bacteroidota bacterium]
MAACAIDILMSTDERETCSLMDLLDIRYDPRLRSVTVLTVDTKGTFMYVGVAGDTIALCIGEDKALMT